MITKSLSDDHGLDIDMLRSRYAAEKARRINPKRSAQFVEVSGQYKSFADDPSSVGVSPRAPIEEDIDVLIIGAGFGGLLAAVECIKAKIGNFRIVDKAQDFGGTWYWNRYPGAQCDVESYIYMPLLDETGYMPSEKYAHGPELFEHARRIGHHFDLYRHAMLQTNVQSMTWQEDERRWVVVTDREDRLHARFVISASGPLSHPRLPGIPGITSFKGRMFHTSRWDYGYTGGDHLGGMSRLKDKRVAVVGTGATAIQCVPYLARDAEHLYVVQRTPPTVGVRGNKPTDAGWFKSLPPGWQSARMANFNAWTSGVAIDEDLVKDGWTALYDLLTAGMPKDGESITPEEGAYRAEVFDFMKGEELRARVDSIVTRPDVAEKLKAWYGVMCKRPAFSDAYLASFNCENVTLVDTEGRGLDEITPDGIKVGDLEYPVDCIVFGTGFELGGSTGRSSHFPIRGVGEELLSEHFANGVRSLHGFYVHGFPNMFMIGNGQNGFKANYTDMAIEQSQQILHVIAMAMQNEFTRIEATAAAESDWIDTLIEKSQAVRAGLEACTPSNFNGEGDVERSFIANTYGGGPIEFSKLLSDWRADGKFAGLSVE
ncbi:MAG TPA: NAD(P)/FAD-dependent oxidoreductase [Sphingobium sp.]